MSTKKLVQAYRALSSIKGDTTPGDRATQRSFFLNAYKTFAEFLSHYAPNAEVQINDQQKRVLDLAKNMNLLLLQLMESDPPAHSFQLQKVVRMMLEMDDLVENSMEDSIVDKINKILSNKRKIKVDIRDQLRDCSALIRTYCSHINLHSAALLIGVNFPVYKYITAEAVGAAVNTLKTTIKAFMDYQVLAMRFKNLENK